MKTLILFRHTSRNHFFRSSSTDQYNRKILVENLSYIRLHGDCHPGNILWREGPVFVDLDDARNGPAIQDIWMLLNGERHERITQLDIILEGYQEFCDFNPSEMKLIEPLRGLRMVHYMAWLVKMGGSSISSGISLV